MDQFGLAQVEFDLIFGSSWYSFSASLSSVLMLFLKDLEAAVILISSTYEIHVTLVDVKRSRM